MKGNMMREYTVSGPVMGEAAGTFGGVWRIEGKRVEMGWCLED